MIKVNRLTGEVTGSIDVEKAWEKVVEVYMQLLEEEENEDV